MIDWLRPWPFSGVGRGGLARRDTVPEQMAEDPGRHAYTGNSMHAQYMPVSRVAAAAELVHLSRERASDLLAYYPAGKTAPRTVRT
jgi:hypothetical protein